MLPLASRANNMPDSSKHSLMAPILYTSESTCLCGLSAAGIGPSCLASRFPPGKTCAEAKELLVLTLWRRRTSFAGEKRRML